MTKTKQKDKKQLSNNVIFLSTNYIHSKGETNLMGYELDHVRCYLKFPQTLQYIVNISNGVMILTLIELSMGNSRG